LGEVLRAPQRKSLQMLGDFSQNLGFTRSGMGKHGVDRSGAVYGQVAGGCEWVMSLRVP